MSKKPTPAAPFRTSVAIPTVVKNAPFAADPLIAMPSLIPAAVAPVLPTPVAATPVCVAPAIENPILAPMPVVATRAASQPVIVTPVDAASAIENSVPAPMLVVATQAASQPVGAAPAIERPAPPLAAPAPVAVAPVAVTPPTPTPAIVAPVTPTPATLALPALTLGLKTMINSKIDFVAAGKDNLEAFTASSKIWTAGVQDLTKQFAATTKASFEESVAAFKALTSVKSVKEAIELQTAYGKSAMTKAMAESTKLTEASRKLTEEALAPITARISVAVGSFSKAA